MNTDSRPICGIAMQALKKNSTRMMITICIGIGLAMYGVYVQSRSHANPSYTPSISIATNWLYGNFGNKMMNTRHMLMGCNKAGGSATKHAVPHFLLRFLVHPVVYYSGFMTGIIHIAQLIILKIYCRSTCGTNTIIGLSALGMVISVICIGGAYATCKMMCISCLGVQHGFIIYYANQRRRILGKLYCPQDINNIGACSTSNKNNNDNGGTTGRLFGNYGSANTGTPKTDLKRRPAGSR